MNVTALPLPIAVPDIDVVGLNDTTDSLAQLGTHAWVAVKAA